MDTTAFGVPASDSGPAPMCAGGVPPRLAVVRLLLPGLLAFLALAAPAAAAPPGVVLSVPSPFASCVADPSPTDPRKLDLEQEPTLASHPGDPRVVVAAWIADESLGVLAARSQDGGRTWSAPVVVPGITRCAGGALDITFNPALSIGPDGTTFLAATSSGGYFPTDPRAAVTRVAVSRLRPGASAWETTFVPGVEGSLDFPTVAADPQRPGEALVSVSKRGFAADAALVSRTTDGGATWSVPDVAHVVSLGRAALTRVVALGERRYAHVMAEFSVPEAFGVPLAGTPVPQGTRQVLRTSTDHGRNWAQGAVIEGGDGIAAVAQGTRLHVASIRRSGATYGVEVRALTQEGRLGPARTAIEGLPAATADPALAVDGRGRLALAAAVPGDEGREVLLWREADGTGPWPQVSLGAPTRTPEPAFYARPQAAGIGSAIGIVSVVGAPGGGDHVTDVVFQRLG
jgi:hypothetical protein